MGQEARCTVRVGRTAHEGKALLETSELIFRSPEKRLVIRFHEIKKLTVTDGVLKVEHAGGTASFELGAAADRWAERIRNPRSRIEKLGIAAGAQVALVGGSDASLVEELAARGALVTPGKPRPGCDVIFLFVDAQAQLAQLGPLQEKLKRDGAFWVIRRKGVKTVTEADVMAAGRAAGLVNVKVVAFSATHTAEKLVIPLARR